MPKRVFCYLARLFNQFHCDRTFNLSHTTTVKNQHCVARVINCCRCNKVALHGAQQSAALTGGGGSRSTDRHGIQRYMYAGVHSYPQSYIYRRTHSIATCPLGDCFIQVLNQQIESFGFRTFIIYIISWSQQVRHWDAVAYTFEPLFTVIVILIY